MRLIAEGRGDRASIAEITEEADIGFGSFYNHFDSKDQLFQTASEEVLERTRPTLSGGHLGIIVLDAPGDSPLAPGRAWAAPRLEVSVPATVHAGVDGEAVDLSPPLRFAIRPVALRGRISPRHPGASPSARLPLPGHPPRERQSHEREGTA